MRPLPRPTPTAAAVFRQCTQRIRDNGRRARLHRSLPAVVQASARFDAAAQARQIHTVAAAAQVGHASTADMVWVYDQKMVRGTGPGRAVYDQILTAAPFGRCPLCGVGTASTLDHHLPKTEYPALAVAPLNLVPACRDCNAGKSTGAPTRPEDATLHPYYDDVTATQWVGAQVGQGPPVHLVYHVAPPPGADALTAARVQAHFDAFGLGPLYAANASAHLVELRDDLARFHSADGASAVADELRVRARSHEARDLNSWSSAAYRALAADPWYCDSGFSAL